MLLSNFLNKKESSRIYKSQMLIVDGIFSANLDVF